jgi:hypothetical protein
MLISTILSFFSSEIYKSNTPTIEIGPGTKITVDTLCYGRQVGTIQFIGDSPFLEDEPGTQRAFVVGNGWTDYILVPSDDDLDSDPDYLAWLDELTATDIATELAD